MSKGPKWERDTARAVSKWWSKKGDDDLFWRTQASGARATVRTKSGKKTRGQYGDLCAVDHRGSTLTKGFVISLKRGYSKKTMQELVDSLENPNRDGAIPEQEYAGWIREAKQCCIDAGTLAWMILVRRDKRKAIIMLPGYLRLHWNLTEKKKLDKLVPQARIVCKVHTIPPLTTKNKKKIIKEYGNKKGKREIKKYIKKYNRKVETSVHIYNMEDFFETITRKIMVDMIKKDLQ